MKLLSIENSKPIVILITILLVSYCLVSMETVKPTVTGLMEWRKMMN